MAERSVHEAAVEAVAGALYAVRYGGDAPGEDIEAVIEGRGFARADARAALTALVASAEVREGLVAALDKVPCKRYPSDHWCGDGGNLSDDDYPQHPACLADAILAAIGGTEAG